VQGVDASASGLVAGAIVDHFGYAVTFLTLGDAVAVALIVFAIGMPETANRESRTSLEQTENRKAAPIWVHVR